MHEDVWYAERGHSVEHLIVKESAADIVYYIGTHIQHTLSGDFRAERVNRYRDIGGQLSDSADTRLNPAQFLIYRNDLSPRTGRITTDINNIGALLQQFGNTPAYIVRSTERCTRTGIKRVRSNIQYPHHKRMVNIEYPASQVKRKSFHRAQI